MKKGKVIFILSLLTSLLTGCFDLGSFGKGDYNAADPGDITEYYSAYYDAIGKISMCKQNGVLNFYSLEDSFFSKSTVNELTWEDEDDAVSYEEYIYMGIHAQQEIKVDALSLYMRAENKDELAGEITTTVYMYVLNSNIFLTVPGYEDPYYEYDKNGNIKYDDFGNPIRKKYDFMDKESAIGSATLTLRKTGFESFTIDQFYNSDTVTVKKGQYIILSFYNNTGYGAHEGLKNVSFTALNLLIRAI